MNKPNNKHILIIDDDAVTRGLFGALLASLGFEVIYGSDGNEGIEMAKRFNPDLILMDFNMPGMNGLDALGALKNNPETSRIPVMFLTIMDLSLEAQKMAKELGALEYIQKGVDREEFLERIQKALPQ